MLVVGAACRDITEDDPRGWRLGGGVSYSALTVARLGVPTRAVIGVDEDNDLAVLQASDPSGLRPLSLGRSSALRVGDPVLAIGSPFGFEQSATSLSSGSRLT